jgi:Fe-S cluster assembly iron-binding protein IscA
MFIETREFSKKVVAPLTGNVAKRIGIYKIPQFGVNPPKGKDVKYSNEEAAEAIQEAVDYFGADEIVRFINWSVTVAAQRRSNNDLRSTTSGLDASSQARVTLLMNMAKREAEAEVGDYDKDGELVIDRKSKAYLEAMKVSLQKNLARPKFADLKPNFEGAEGGSTTYDLTAPGSLSSEEKEPEAEDKESETESTEETPQA